MIVIMALCYKNGKLIMTAACYESGNNNDESNNNKNKVCFAFRKIRFSKSCVRSRSRSYV